MSDRMIMAEALLKRTKERREEIGDHGDPYEDSLLANEVTVELKIVVKEIFDHLRSILDYCARDICEKHDGGNVEKPVYFPIVKKDFDRNNFKARVGQLMPGVQNNEKLLDLFETFQAFSSRDNNWLPEFATLCNENKHQQLNVINCSCAIGTVFEENGKSMITITKEDGVTPFVRSPFMIMRNWPEDGNGTCEFTYISFEEIDEELLWFLDACISGVEKILKKVQDIVVLL